uniref:3'-5' exonuclease domain-containing protein n=1 Tax=Lutzomyia longipalpis TaxID=7200 RepID=A0A1B0CE09_LUTLO
MYDMPKELTPNMNKRHNYGALQFLIHKRFIDKSLNKDSWQEMVKVTVPMDAPDLQLELVNACSDFGDTSDGAMWAKYFNVPHNDLPVDVREFVAGKPSPYPQYPHPDDWDKVDQGQGVAYHRLRKDTKIILVATRTEFREMIDYLREQSVVGFDAEWKPTFRANNEVALIQLATRTRVYLIDVICLRVQSEDWTRLGRLVFNNDEVLKLGFSPANDVSILPKISAHTQSPSRYFRCCWLFGFAGATSTCTAHPQVSLSLQRRTACREDSHGGESQQPRVPLSG